MFEILYLLFFGIIALSSTKSVSAISSKLWWFRLLTIVYILSEYKPCTKQIFRNLSDSVEIPAVSFCSQSCKAEFCKFWSKFLNTLNPIKSTLYFSLLITE
jgi:hypothetical protein